MRTNTNSRLLAVLVAAAIAAPLTLSASVQPEGRRGFRGDRGGHRGPGRILRELDLSEEQQSQLRALRERSESDSFERVQAARRALDEAVENGADEGTLRQLAYQLGEAQGDAAIERSRMHAQFLEILTPEQRQQYETLKAEQEQQRAERRERMENRRNRNPDAL